VKLVTGKQTKKKTKKRIIDYNTRVVKKERHVVDEKLDVNMAMERVADNKCIECTTDLRMETIIVFCPGCGEKYVYDIKSNKYSRLVTAAENEKMVCEFCLDFDEKTHECAFKAEIVPPGETCAYWRSRIEALRKEAEVL